MSSLLNKNKDKGTWHKVSDLHAGLEIAVPRESCGSLASADVSNDILWDKIVSIKPVGREQVYDIEVEGTHNFVGNDIFAHNTYVLKSGDITADAPNEVLTADKSGVDLTKLAVHTLHDLQDLVAEFAVEDTKLVSLETRVEALESGAVGTGSTTVNIGTELASALESFGVLIKKGIAQFNTLVFQRLVAATDSTGASSAGSVSVLTGNTVAQVTNSLVLPSTKIFVTFNSQIVGSWWVSDKQNGGFRVILSEAQNSDVSFDYFLVQTDGALVASASAVVSEVTIQPTSQVVDTTQPIITSSEIPVATSTDSIATSTPVSADVTAPVVTLTGDAAIEISQNSTFTDPGATATDDTDADLTTHINVSGSVDTATVGLYTITYTVTDAAGNTGSVSRVVTVIAPSPAESAPAPEPAESVAPVESAPPLESVAPSDGTAPPAEPAP